MKNEEYFRYLNDLNEDSQHELIFQTINKKDKNIISNNNLKEIGTLKNAENLCDENNINKDLSNENDAEKKSVEESKRINAEKDKDGFVTVTKKKKK